MTDALTTTDSLQECPVCYGDCGTNPALPCTHILCKACEERIRAIPVHEGGCRCPLCRASLAPALAPAQPPDEINWPDRVAALRRLETLYDALDAYDRQVAIRDQVQQLVLNRRAMLADMQQQVARAEADLAAQQQLVSQRHRLVREAAAAAEATQRLPEVAAPAPAAVARAQGHLCGHRDCQRNDAALVQLDGFTRRVWRCPVHQH